MSAQVCLLILINFKYEVHITAWLYEHLLVLVAEWVSNLVHPQPRNFGGQLTNLIR